MVGFTVDDLLALAGHASFERGLEYVDQVSDLHRTAEGVRATVAGTYPYDVLLTLDRDTGIDGQCSCPYGEEGNFCKHCVAVGLAVLAGEGEPAAPITAEPASGRGSAQDDLVQRFLRTLDRTELVGRLLALANTDPTLHRRLSLEAARADATTPDLSAVTFELNSTLRVRGFLSYQDSYNYADEARTVHTAVNDLVAAGFAAEAERLAKRGVELLTKALLKMDDSGGAAGSVLYAFVELHARACALAPPDPVKLARWLVALEVDGPGWPSVDIAAYAPGLGSRGLAAYRAKLEALATATADSPDLDFRRLTVTRLRADLAEHEGNVDELVAILTAGRMHPDSYLRIATLMRAGGRATEALDWAERGLATVSWHFTPKLAHYVAGEYLAAGRAADAVRLRRDRFGRHPSQTTYAELRQTATLIGANRWSNERAWALDHLRAAARSGHARSSTDAGSVLVQVLLAESDDQGAWEAYSSWGADEATAMELARRRAPQHPGEVIPIFQAEVESLTRSAKTNLYPRAAKLVVQIRDCYRRSGNEPGWTEYLTALVAGHRRRTSFIAALDKRGLLPSGDRR